jgi:hypothetical protein
LIVDAFRDCLLGVGQEEIVDAMRPSAKDWKLFEQLARI